MELELVSGSLRNLATEAVRAAVKKRPFPGIKSVGLLRSSYFSWQFRVVVYDNEEDDFIVYIGYPSRLSDVRTEVTTASKTGPFKIYVGTWLGRPNGEWENLSKAEYSVREGYAWRVENEIAKPKADRTLDRLHLLLPLHHRETLIGDLREIVDEMRRDGFPEKVLCRYIYLQVFYVVFERLKPWNWAKGGAVLWLVHKLIG